MDPQHAESFLTSVRASAAEVVHDAYSAVMKGDFDAFAESVTDDVELNVCGFGPMDGSWRGRNEVVDATRRNFAMVVAQKPEVESMISQGEIFAVLFRESGVMKSNGQSYSVRCVQWFTVANGKIKKIDEVVASVWKFET